MYDTLVATKADGEFRVSIEQLQESDFPDGPVAVDVAYSAVNYKDGLCLRPDGGGLVRSYPHVGGIDFAGTVARSTDDRYEPGDQVISTGWRVGEVHWGGYSQRAVADADWLVPLPAGMTLRHAMSLGTAGLAAMLGVLEIEATGVVPGDRPVLVTGASGGVGSLAVVMLSELGYEVCASTGRAENAELLQELGATSTIGREDLEPSGRVLDRETYSAAIDAVGGSVLAAALPKMAYGAPVAAVGLAGGSALDATLIPFLLRGVRLIGIDSVMQPYEARVAAWERMASATPPAKVALLTEECALSDVLQVGQQILHGQVRGRMVVDLGAGSGGD